MSNKTAQPTANRELPEHLQQSHGVTDNRTVLIAVGGAGIAPCNCIAPTEPKAFEHPRLQGVIDAHIALPLVLIAVGGIDMITQQIGRRGFKPGHTEGRKVVSVFGQPGTLTSVSKLTNLTISDQ